MTHKNIRSSLRTFSFLEPLKSSYFLDNLSLDVLIKGVHIKKKKCSGARAFAHQLQRSTARPSKPHRLFNRKGRWDLEIGHTLGY